MLHQILDGIAGAFIAGVTVIFTLGFYLLGYRGARQYGWWTATGWLIIAVVLVYGMSYGAGPDPSSRWIAGDDVQTSGGAGIVHCVKLTVLLGTAMLTGLVRGLRDRRQFGPEPEPAPR